MTDNLATVVEVAIDRVIGTLPRTDVDTALRHTLGPSAAISLDSEPSILSKYD